MILHWAVAVGLVAVHPLLNLIDRFGGVETRDVEGNGLVNSQSLGTEANLPGVAASLSQNLPQRCGMEAGHLCKLFSLLAFKGLVSCLGDFLLLLVVDAPGLSRFIESPPFRGGRLCTVVTLSTVCDCLLNHKIYFIKIYQNTPQLCWGDEWSSLSPGGRGLG